MLSMSVTILNFTTTETHSVQATATTQSLRFMPPLQDNVLSKLTQEKNTLLRVLVTDVNSHTTYYKNDIPLLLHSRWLMQWTKENRLQVAAWVTPQDRAVGNLVTKAVSYLKIQTPPLPTGMVGYNNASPGQVIDQVDALYDALRAYGMHYVNATVPYAGPDQNTMGNEYVKLPSEVLKQHSGMCVELTTLLASAVERIGLQAEIVIIPGHAFLGVATQADLTQFAYWDVVDINNNVAGDSANVAADALYAQNVQRHTLVDTIVVQDARSVGINPML